MSIELITCFATFASSVDTKHGDKHEEETGLGADVFCWLLTLIRGVLIAGDTFTCTLFSKLLADKLTPEESSVSDVMDEIIESVILILEPVNKKKGTHQYFHTEFRFKDSISEFIIYELVQADETGKSEFSVERFGSSTNFKIGSSLFLLMSTSSFVFILLLKRSNSGNTGSSVVALIGDVVVARDCCCFSKYCED